ncbi:MAG TPA: DNA-processing protein DprA [Galbitalea sp.]|jgi:DNA processing protein|nr:DNA-processing protein DprA [Galbitalea sp.]
MFGLGEAEVATLIRSIAGESLDREEIRDRFARATWTGIAEPGDRTAGLVVQALGAADALDAVVARWPAPQWSAAIVQSGVDGVPESEFQQAIERWQPRLKSATALLAVRQAARYGSRLLVPDVAGWPIGVDDLGLHAPIALWARGTENALDALNASVAVVGARAATGYGEHVTMEVSAGLVDRGFAIVSGAAYGIDGMAHRAALASHGMTVAFLAGGVDRFYPAGHDALLTRMVEEGAIISELPCGQPPTKWRFLQRNRLIAAASQATVVIEAGWRSGSLNTAGHAAQMGRPVGAVPGPVTSAASSGCHRLIRDYDATLVTNADEIAELVGTPPHPPRSQTETGAASEQAGSETAHRSRPAEETRLLDAISQTSPREVKDIAARAGLSLAAVQSLLGALELEELVTERERGWVKTKPKDPTKPPPPLA